MLVMEILFHFTVVIVSAYYAHRCTEANIQGLPGQASGDSGVDICSSSKQIHEVAREGPAQGQALQQNCVTARSMYSDSDL
jgi:hypothetical protein